MLKRHKVYTGSGRIPYIQFMAVARVISTKKFVVGVTNERERDRSQVSNGKIKWVLRARLPLSYVV